MEWVLVGLGMYLLVGLAFAFRWRLAFMINAQVAMLDFREQVPQWKKRAFHILLRLGVVMLYPIFLIWR